jgi:transcription elongation factor
MRKRPTLLEEGDGNIRLLDQEFSLEDLSNMFVNATQDELDAFSRGHDEQVADALKAGTVMLKHGDKVCVFAGSLQGLEGTITEFHDDHTITFALPGPPTTAPTHLQVPASDVHKKFVRGDYVCVMHSTHRGQEGFIIEINDTKATIYNPQGMDGEV